MTGSIFDGNFQTSLPDTSGPLNLMAAALAARQKALDPTGIFSGLKSAGKVFTDMESELKKNNTALLQRHLDAMTPNQIEQMIANGVDPVKEAYLAGVPINGADTELNKAWDKDITDAGTQIANRWVATVLPTLSHEARMELMGSNDPAIWDKYGLSPIARITPDVQQQIKTALQDAATSELLKLAADEDVVNAANQGELPTRRVLRRVDPNILDAADKNAATSFLTNADQTAKSIAANTAEINTLTGGESTTNELADNRKEQLNEEEASITEDVKNGIFGRLKEGKPYEVVNDLIEEFLPYAAAGRGIDLTPTQINRLTRYLKDWYANPQNKELIDQRIKEHETPVYTKRFYDNYKDIRTDIDRVKVLKSRNDPKAAEVEKNLNYHFETDWKRQLFPLIQNLVKEGRIGTQQFDTWSSLIEDRFNDPEAIKGVPADVLEISKKAFKTVLKDFRSHLNDFTEYQEKQKELDIAYNRDYLRGQDSVFRNLLDGEGKNLPADIQTLTKANKLDLVARKLLKHDDYTAYKGTDELTQGGIVYEALLHYQAITNESRTVTQILEDIKDLHPIHDDRFSTLIHRAIRADIANRHKAKQTKGEMKQYNAKREAEME